MKFVKIITKHTNAELDKILAELDNFSFETLLHLYESFQYIEIEMSNGHSVLYAGIEEKQIEKLMSEYVKNEIDFTYEDITKSILYGELPQIEKEEDSKKLLTIINQFLDENLDKDTVLEKLSEAKYDIKQLSKRDLQVLQEV